MIVARLEKSRKPKKPVKKGKEFSPSANRITLSKEKITPIAIRQPLVFCRSA